MLRELSQRQNEMRLMLLQITRRAPLANAGGARISPTAAGLTQPATAPERPAPGIPTEMVLELSACPVCESCTYTGRL